MSSNGGDTLPGGRSHLEIQSGFVGGNDNLWSSKLDVLCLVTCSGAPRTLHWLPTEHTHAKAPAIPESGRTNTDTRDQISAASHFCLWWNSDCVLHSSHRRILQFWVLHPSKKRGLEHLEQFFTDSMRRCQANGGFGAAQTAKTYLSHTTRRHSLTPQLANSKQFFFLKWSQHVELWRYVFVFMWKDCEKTNNTQTSSSDDVHSPSEENQFLPSGNLT